MNKERFLRRGWLCGLLSPVVCLIFILLQMAGVWESGERISVVLACIQVCTGYGSFLWRRCYLCLVCVQV